MFDEKDLVHHPTETSIRKLLFRVQRIYMIYQSSTSHIVIGTGHIYLHENHKKSTIHVNVGRFLIYHTWMDKTWLFHQTSIIRWLFRVQGTSIFNIFPLPPKKVEPLIISIARLPKGPKALPRHGRHCFDEKKLGDLMVFFQEKPWELNESQRPP